MPNATFPNAEQRRVLAHPTGALLVLAPAGTGKTRVMAERLRAVIADGTIAAGRTLCLTFTNRAAAQMREQVQQTLGPAARGIEVRTFHGLCARILRIEADALGLARDFCIYDEEDCQEILRQLGCTDPQALRDVLERIGRAKAQDPDPRPGRAWIERAFAKDPALADLAFRYQVELAARQALDYDDLVHQTRIALRHLPSSRARWAHRYDWVQVDEVQDTHQSEFDVLGTLARRTGNLAVFGDLDQTIYTWRGSAPGRLLADFERDFAPVTRLQLRFNYRATRALLAAADRFAATLAERRTAISPAPDLAEGEPLRRLVTETDLDEAAAVARELRRAKPRTAVLVRTHRRAEAISAALSAAGVRHLTVEQFEFFRRQEIKDVLARLRLVLHPADTGALRRCLLRPKHGVGEQVLQVLRDHGAAAGVTAAELLRPGAADGDPHAPLLAAWRSGEVVVLDVETTGLEAGVDAVIEIAAMRLRQGRRAETFHRLLRVDRPVGESVQVHGITDAVLARDGSGPAQALRELRAFVGDAHVVGHNVRFDLLMLRADAARHGVPFGEPPHDDTLLLARGLLPGLDNYRLATLAERFQVPQAPSHRATDDVAATAAVLAALIDDLQARTGVRLALCQRIGPKLKRLADHLRFWRHQAERLPLPELLAQILEESGLRAFYEELAGREPRRLAHLAEFERMAARFQAAHPYQHPWHRLDAFVRDATLAKSAWFADASEDAIPVITVHQAKGLEFDHVVVAGLRKGEFPIYRKVEKAGEAEEERRLFYVAITRARQSLLLTGHRQRAGSPYHDGPSAFLQDLGLGLEDGRARRGDGFQVREDGDDGGPA